LPNALWRGTSQSTTLIVALPYYGLLVASGNRLSRREQHVGAPLVNFPGSPPNSNVDNVQTSTHFNDNIVRAPV